MIIIGNLLLILGVCLSTVGAAGFADTLEDLSLEMFSAGILLVIIGGLTVRRATRSSGAGTEHLAAALGDLQLKIQTIATRVSEIDEAKEILESVDFCKQIDDLLCGEYFELGARNEEFQQLLGFSKYSKVWSGIAVCERLLARAWSIATDGHFAEAKEELPLARAEIQNSLQVSETL
ncbi:MAG: hypothetical protein H8E15_00465 [Planctomycetes bacterium]|nr:hypothetical protein [Planctomycetota bacterium]